MCRVIKDTDELVYQVFLQLCIILVVPILVLLTTLDIFLHLIQDHLCEILKNTQDDKPYNFMFHKFFV